MADSAASSIPTTNGLLFPKDQPTTTPHINSTTTTTTTTTTHYLKSDHNSIPAASPAAYTPGVDSKMSTTLKARVASGETLYGLFLMSASPTIAEIVGLAGYDFVVVDMEHGPGGISDALPLAGN